MPINRTGFPPKNFIKSPAQPQTAMKSKSRKGLGADMGEGALNQRFIAKPRKPKNVL
jgi:hypothetical protein